ncbi:hypothetical protein BGX29_005705 [Mortierella sp. GBA35]|nr:hypothetical protein BGX29_005705 [Mortierella sp. GBA35]
MIKYHHLVRVTNNVQTSAQMLNLGRNSQLHELSIVMGTSALQYAQVLGFVSKNIASLEKLQLKAGKVQLYGPKRESPLHCVHAIMLAHPRDAINPIKPTVSKLRELDISGLWLTRDVFVTILQGCPHLSHLNMSDTDVLGHVSMAFQHKRLSSLTCSIIAALRPDFGDTTIFPPISLLAYLPNLKTWFTWVTDSQLKGISVGWLRAVVKKYCPLLTDVRLVDCSSSVWETLFSEVFSNLTTISFEYKLMSLPALTTILLHQDTLKSIQARVAPGFDFETDFVASAVDHFQASGRKLQLLPRSCPRLTSLNLYPHVMDMEIVELPPWRCRGLKTLLTKIKGLDSKDRIHRAIDLWRAGWRERALERRKSNLAADVDGEEEIVTATSWLGLFKLLAAAAEDKDSDVVLLDSNLSLEARVARFLLGFQQLESVWLGNKTWTPY